MEQIEMPMKEVFASYHWTSHDLKYNGFGNFIGRFHMEIYVGQMAKFIEDLEKSISISLEHKLNMKVSVKILFFR